MPHCGFARPTLGRGGVAQLDQSIGFLPRGPQVRVLPPPPRRAGVRVRYFPAARHGACGILFLDELTSAAPTVSAAAYQLILDRRLGQCRVPDGWAIFTAGNCQGDRGVSYAMPAPLAPGTG